MPHIEKSVVYLLTKETKGTREEMEIFYKLIIFYLSYKVNRLRQFGVPVRGRKQEHHMHHKFVIVDSKGRYTKIALTH